MKTFKIALLFFSGMMILSTFSCKKDIEGCTEVGSLNYNPQATVDDGSCINFRDKIIGDWDAVKFILDGNDAIGLGLFVSIEFEFEADGDFEWSAIPISGNALIGDGSWVVNGDFLEVDLSATSDTFCGDSSHSFSFEFDGDDELNLEDVCSNGTGMQIELDKS